MIKSAKLYTNNIKALRRFYVNILELEMTESTAEQFTVRIGESHLTFKHSEQPAFYHFAINIPGNQFSMMKYWMVDRVTLNREEGRDEVYFQSFDADSMYFEDPVGNIVELIGRRKRDLFGDLTKESFLSLSEIGLVTPHVAEVGDQLQNIGLPLRGGTEVDPDTLNFLGRGDTFIVLVPQARRWYFSKKTSETFPLEMTWNDVVIKLDGEGKLNT